MQQGHNKDHDTYDTAYAILTSENYRCLRQVPFAQLEQTYCQHEWHQCLCTVCQVFRDC